MKEVTVTVQFVITTEVSNDTDLKRMEVMVEEHPQSFIRREFVESEDFVHVSVELDDPLGLEAS